MTLGLFTKEQITFWSRFGTWFGPFPDLKAWFYSLWMQSSFKSTFLNALLKRENNGVFDRDPPRKPDSEDTCTQSSSEHDPCVCILDMHAEAMHGSISADCAVGTKYYLAVRRSCSWLGRRLQCMWTHVVQITNPIRKRIAIRNGFRNVIHSFVNRPIVYIAIRHDLIWGLVREWRTNSTSCMLKEEI